MMINRLRNAAVLAVCGVAAATIVLRPPVLGDDKPDSAAVERARKQVRMLDDLYKTAIVLVTTHYVEEDSDLAAGDAFQALFAAMKEKGWHEVRLLDASGQPIDEENLPKDAFEKRAVEQLKKGETFVERVITRDGKSYLRAATPIPVVMEKCTMCHENYKGVREGQPIGALGYTVPIE